MSSAAATTTEPTEQPPRSVRPGVVAHRIFIAAVVAQTLIVITGAGVRITGSGLGCPTWPRCDETVVPRPADGINTMIEFGNRLLSVGVGIVLIACVIVAWRMRPRRKPLVLLAGLGLAGTLAQGAIGGITVLTKLHPITVATHFLLSMVLIALALALVVRHREGTDGPVVPLVRPELRLAGHALLAAAAVVLVLGTVVTGSGPHSGDAEHPARFGFDVRAVAWLHADAVLVFVGVLAAVLLGLRLTGASHEIQQRGWLVAIVTAAQGAIGYLQYLTGVPEILVMAHVIGACLLWLSVLWFWFGTRTRAVAGSTGAATPEPD